MDRGGTSGRPSSSARRLAAHVRRRVGRLLSRRPDPESTAREDPSTDAFLPSFGLFGGLEANHLAVRVGSPLTGRLTGLELSLPDTEVGRLDLRGIHTLRRGQRVPVDVSGVRAHQSSVASPDRRAEGAFELASIRTTKEAGAWWRAEMDPPLDVDEIHVFNRRDGRALRNRRLRVSLRADDGTWALVEDVAGRHHLDATLALLSRLTGIGLSADALTGTPTAVRALRTRVLAVLATQAGRGPLTADAEEQRLLWAVLPLRRSRTGNDLTDDEWTLLAHLLLAERRRVPGTATSFRLLSLVLTSRPLLARLEHEMNRAGTAFGFGPMSITRHGVRDAGALRRQAAPLLILTRRVIAEFAALELPLMLGYGTLLGAVREGTFLEHDDDVDLMYPVEARSAAEARAHAADLCRVLEERGYRIWRNTSATALNFHVIDPASERHVDVFPIMISGGDATLHMQRMELRTVPTELILPVRPVAFLGTALPAPADPQGFLTARYGPSWSVPDPYDDWIWPLHDQ